MKKLASFFPILVLVCLFSGCTKDEIPPPESEDAALKAATTVEKITITRTLPNGKVITIEVPPSAVEGIIEQTPRLPYSPEGVYVFEHKKTKEKYDVFITSFDGVWTTGTFGYPAGGNYTLTGDLLFSGMVSGHAPTGFRIITGFFIIDNQKEFPFEVWTSEFHGIIKELELDDDNNFVALRTKPYSPEGHYLICEYKGTTPIYWHEVWITFYDNKNFEGKYVSRSDGDVVSFGDLVGNVGAPKDGLSPFMMEFYSIKIPDEVYKTIEGTVDEFDGLNGFEDPFGWPPPIIIVE